MTSLHAFVPFDIQKAPLDGTTLIEASAGTGKTYTLTALFLRLLVEKALPVDRILVVTFTEAATGELKERIRARLRSALDALSDRITKDPFAPAFAETVDKGPAIQILRRAIQDFDRAAIFTIHGFCRRVLSEYAFETGVPFDTELLTDTHDLKRSMVEDFWRRRMHAFSPLFVAYARDRGFTPDRFLGLIQKAPSLLKPEVIPRQEIPDDSAGESAFLEAFQRVAQSWSESRVAVEEILAHHPALNRNQYRKTAVQGWIRAMNAFALPGRNDALPFPDLEKFTTSQLLRGTRKGHTPPSHVFFDQCDRLMNCWEALSASFDRTLLGLQAAIFDEVETGAEQWKAARNAWSFDDLLRHVYAALQGTDGGRLAVALRSRYRAALIDEFQDTDPVQYGIFQKVFGPNDTPLFLIGDPKQAIYGFRGADIFAYLDAARHATRRATLLLNHRSEPGLVRAVNTLYDGHENPFAFQDISFHEVEPARKEGDLPLLQVKGQIRPPLRIWFLEAEEGAGRNGKIPKDTGRKRIPEAVARKIRRLLAQGRAGDLLLGERPVREGDVAVLLRTNREARIVQQALARWSVPAVLYTGSSLFDTTEAAEMILLLEALARPDREGLFRAAQVTSILGWDGADLQALSSDAGLLENRLLRFRSLHETWKSRGFYSMLRDLLRTEEVLPRLLRMPGGERRATNLLHLAEILHRAETAQRFGMGGLIQWLAEQRDPRTRETEEEPLRLESDGNAVKLVTIHKSKGLEYPIVFCPFAWHGSGVGSKEPFSFHDPQNGFRLTLDLGSPEPDRRVHAALAERESLSENMRIFYVAVTRARNRCYMVWGRFNEAETSAPAYLFHSRHMEPEKTPVEASALRFEEMQAPEMRQDLETLAEASGGAIRISSLETGDADVPPPRADARPVLSAPTFRARIDRSWTIASFSSLTSSHRHAEDVADHDVLPAPEESRGIMSEAALQDEGYGDGFRAFPRGARSGTCLHAIFEVLDFMDTGETALSERVRKTLLEYGFDPSWGPAVCDMIRNVVALPLDAEYPGLRLERIPMKHRLNELPFFFPINRITPHLLGTLMADHGEIGSIADLPERIGRLGFAPARGFMRGFVDLVFRHEERFFLVDWKSNDLGPSREHYAPERLSRAMVDGLYHVQAFLYTLALDRYLALRLPGYRYDLHFGGAYYVFLRGADPERGPGSGVHRVRPSTPMMEDLRKVLIPETACPGPKEPRS